MKHFKLYLLKAYIKLGLFFYYKKIEVHGLNNIPKGKPVLLVSNHQNALLDALLIATSIKKFAHYLARAGVFKNNFVSKLLHSFQLIPVYRIRDGFGNLTNNNAIFNKAAQLLNNNEMVTIFPEGSHNLARRVRALSKGFTRIIYNVIDENPDSDLQLVPIGLNFKTAKNCPDSVAIYFGKPINVKDYISEHKNESIINIKTKVQNEIAQLTTHIPVANYKNTLSILENLNVDFLDPKSVNQCIANNFEDCKIAPKTNWSWLQKVFKYALILNLFLPYLIWKYSAEPKIKEVEFKSTFRFALAITIVPIYILILAIVLTLFLSFKIAVIYSISVLIIAFLAIKL